MAVGGHPTWYDRILMLKTYTAHLFACDTLAISINVDVAIKTSQFNYGCIQHVRLERVSGLVVLHRRTLIAFAINWAWHSRYLISSYRRAITVVGLRNVEPRLKR